MWDSHLILEYQDYETSGKTCDDSESVPGSGGLADPAQESLLLTLEKGVPWSTFARSAFTYSTTGHDSCKALGMVLGIAVGGQGGGQHLIRKAASLLPRASALGLHIPCPEAACAAASL